MTKSVRLRKALFSDAVAIFDCRNYPSVRGVSKNFDRIPWDQHISWYSRLIQGGSWLSIVEVEHDLDRSIVGGYCRVDKISGDCGLISIALFPRYCGDGLGQKLLHDAKHSSGFNTLLAEVKIDNKAGLIFFKKNGFKFEQKKVDNFIQGKWTVMGV